MQAAGLVAAVPIGTGLLILRRSAARRIGWLLVAHGLCVAIVLGRDSRPSTSRAGMVIDQLTSGSWTFLFLWLALTAYFLPDGRLASRRWRFWVATGLVGELLFLIGSAGDTNGFREEHHNSAPPVAWLPEGLSGLMGAIGLLLVALLLFGSAVSVWRRLRCATGVVRLQLLWPVWGALSVPFTLSLFWTDHFLLGGHQWLITAGLVLTSVALPVTIAAAVLRYRLFDIEVLLSRTLTYGALTLSVTAVYGTGLLLAERFFDDRTAGGLLAVVVVAIGAQPVAAFLRQRIERWVFGYRSDPHAALLLLADRAESADPLHLTATITAAVIEALKVDQAWVEHADHPTTSRVQGAVRAPLVHRGLRVGELVVQVSPQRHLTRADTELLHALARYAAVLVHADQLTDDLRQSRARIVGAREEERRRLRRDLHDGVGPSLAAIVLTLNAAQQQPEDGLRNPLLGEAREEVRGAIDEVRRLVDDLRPPAIDEVGLLGAIRQRAETLLGSAVEVTGPATWPLLPAAVEVAAYRIASEAITNVVRHSGATRCRIAIALEGPLVLTIADNGRGAEPGTERGVGWTSMEERAAELGGLCTITNRPAGGLLVRATLPLEPELSQAAKVEEST